MIRFFEALKTFYPEFEFGNSDMEHIFNKVYPGKKFSNVLMRKVFSLTTKLLQEFITVNSFRKDKLEFNIKMIDKLRERKLPQMFEKKSKQINILMQNSIRNLDFYESKLKYTSILNGHLLNTNKKSMINKMQNELDDFIEYFLTVIFLLYIRMSE